MQPSKALIDKLIFTKKKRLDFISNAVFPAIYEQQALFCKPKVESGGKG